MDGEHKKSPPRSMGSKLRQAMGGLSIKRKEQSPRRTIRSTVQRTVSSLSHEPQLSSYIVTFVFRKPEGVSFSELARTLLDAKDRYKDKTFRSHFPAYLLKLYFFEYIPTDVVARLVPCLEVAAKNGQVTRSLLYVIQSHVGRGHAGTPTLLEQTAATFGPDSTTLKVVVEQLQKLLNAQDTQAAVKRYALCTLAIAARQDGKLLPVLSDALTMMITEVDKTPKKYGDPNQPASATDWDLQHSVFQALRVSCTPAVGNDIAGACFLGLGSPDPVGARHALALAEEICLKNAVVVMQEFSSVLEPTLSVYQNAGPDGCSPPRCPINLTDRFSRAHMARICARVVHSDHGSSDVSSKGGAFWQMLCSLIARDPSDMVRFAALGALTGAVVTSNEQTLGPFSFGSGRDEAVLQQRRARAWRLLVAQAATELKVPGVTDSSGNKLKLMDLIGRLILLALNKPVKSARFNVAASLVSSLARSCIAFQIAGSTRSAPSSEVDKVMKILAKEISGLIETPLSGQQRAACIEASLYLQAAGYHAPLSPTSFTLVGGEGGSGAGSQDSLLAAVLRCARACPDQAPLFLEYASGVVSISPAAVDLGKVTALWNASRENKKSGNNAALVAALAALRSPLPPSVMSRTDASQEQTLRAARSDAGWTSFLATAAWWLGEHANELCGEYVGQKVKALMLNTETAVIEETASEGSVFEEEPQEKDSILSQTEPSKLIEIHSTRSPALALIIATLHDVILGGSWQLRAAATRALGKIAIRSGEPFRLQCYGILVSVSGSEGQDSLGLRGVSAPALSALDKIYSSQVIIKKLWEEHGPNPEEWPEDIVTSVFRRAKLLHEIVENTICSVPSAKYALLGPKSVQILSQAGDEGPAYAAFLQTEDKEMDGGSLANRTTRSKNKEVEEILSLEGTDESAFNFLSRGTEPRQSKDKEIETLLERSDVSSTPWDTMIDQKMDNAEFKERKDSMNAINAFDEIRTESYGIARADFSPSTSIASPSRSSMEKEPVGRGVMIHTFIAAPNNPEELSIFEGDAVEVIDFCEDGWLLVRDPSSHQGLVPESYVDIQSLRDSAKDQRHANPSNPWSTMASQESQQVESPERSNETLLNQVFASETVHGGGVPAGESWGLAPSPKPASQNGSPRKVAVSRQGSMTLNNPFISHRRQPSASSHHNRTLSGNSDLLGSIPGSPSRIEGPERTINAPFRGEMEGELTVRPGDRVKVISDIGGWTKVIRIDDKQVGLVPEWAVGSSD